MLEFQTLGFHCGIDEAGRGPWAGPVVAAAVILPEDYNVIPESYFNRHFLFSGYYDLGLIGILVSSFLGGITYSFFWRLTNKLINYYQETWPIFVYLPIPAISSYFVASGNLGYGFINALIPAATIFTCVLIAKMASFFRNSSLTESKYG